MGDIVLNDENFVIYAIKAYDNPQCLSMSDFQEDLKKIKYVKRLFNRFLKTGEIKERLVLNHLITLYNLFGPEHTTRMLFFKLEKKYYPVLKTFLAYLGYMPDVLTGLPQGDIISSKINTHSKLVALLQKL